jgi:hypothetical protein
LWQLAEHRIIAHVTTHALDAPTREPEVMPVHGIDHLELYVGNAAVMCDTFAPLHLTAGREALDDGRYALAWATDAEEVPAGVR